MSQLLLLQKYFQNIKVRLFIDQVNDIVFQGWSQMHSLLFWMVSVMSNYWKLKENNHSTMVMNGSFLFGNDGQSPNTTPTQTSLHNHQHNINRGHEKPSTPITQPSAINLQPKPKSPRKKHQLTTIDTSFSYSLKDRKAVVVKKQSLTMVKNQMLSWKQKLSNKTIADDLISPTTMVSKKSFLRRRLSSDNSDANHSDSSSSRSEPPSPTTSILKTISFKLKRPQDNMTDYPPVGNTCSMRRLSLSNFKRKNSSDLTLK